MQATAEYVEEFLSHVDQPDWAFEERWPQIWAITDNDTDYEFKTMGPDPYELLPNVVEYVKVHEAPTFFIMTGWMTKIVDENDDDYDELDEPERMRVRVILGAAPNTEPFVAVERDGAPVEIFENMGEGMFPEVFKQLMADN